MEAMTGLVHSAVELPLGLLDRVPPIVSLTLISVLSGVVILWIVGKLTNQKRLAIARDRMASSIYEMRLFMDSPARIARAQLRFFRWSTVYIAHTLPPLLVLALPLTLLYVHLEVRWAIAPLPVGAPVLVKVDLDVAPSGEVKVEETAGFRVTAPPLRVPGEERVYVRVQIDEPGTHDLRLKVGAHEVTKKLYADPAAPMVSPERSAGLDALWRMGVEPPIASGAGVAVISVAHALRTQEWLGIEMPWWIYWLVVSMAVAMALRRPMGVVL